MGFFFNRKKDKQQQQWLAELQQRREPLFAQFERGIASLAPVYEEAMELGYGKGVDRNIPNIHVMLLLDFVSIVCTIGAATGDPTLSMGKSGGRACYVAFDILRRVAPEQLPEVGTFFPNIPTTQFDDPIAQHGAEEAEFEMACKALRSGCKFGTPGMLLVMQEYDEACGTLYAYTVADMFLAFMLELEAPPVALKGAPILESYISMLREYIAKKPSEPSGHSAGAFPRMLEAYEALGVQPDCTDDELKEAYLQKVNYWHPDKFHAAQLPIEMKEMATREMAKVNEAYDRLKTERQLAQPNGLSR